MARADRPFRFPVQWVNRPNGDFRGFSGTVAVRRGRAGRPVLVDGLGARVRAVKEIVTFDGPLDARREPATRSP